MSIQKYEECFMNRLNDSNTETLLGMARRADLHCMRGIRANFVNDHILRNALLQKYRAGIFVTLLTRFSREVVLHMGNFLGEPSKFYGHCNLAIIIGTTSWEMYSNNTLNSWVIKKTIESTDNRHSTVRSMNARTFYVDASYDEFYEIPNYETVQDALLGVGYTVGDPIDFKVNVSDGWDLDKEEFLAFPLEEGPTFVAWIDQPNRLPEWHDKISL
jgi:hypothetical protein